MTPVLLPASGCLALLLSLWANIGMADPVRATQEPRCETGMPEIGDRREVTCALPSSSASVRVSFKVRFLGSHDDTQLSMAPVLDGEALTCDVGSKTQSRFEDGEITLECRFSVMAKADANQLLKVAIIWTHAQYDGFEIAVL